VAISWALVGQFMFGGQIIPKKLSHRYLSRQYFPILIGHKEKEWPKWGNIKPHPLVWGNGGRKEERRER